MPFPLNYTDVTDSRKTVVMYGSQAIQTTHNITELIVQPNQLFPCSVLIVSIQIPACNIIAYAYLTCLNFCFEEWQMSKITVRITMPSLVLTYHWYNSVYENH